MEGEREVGTVAGQNSGATTRRKPAAQVRNDWGYAFRALAVSLPGGFAESLPGDPVVAGTLTGVTRA